MCPNQPLWEDIRKGRAEGFGVRAWLALSKNLQPVFWCPYGVWAYRGKRRETGVLRIFIVIPPRFHLRHKTNWTTVARARTTVAKANTHVAQANRRAYPLAESLAFSWAFRRSLIAAVSSFLPLSRARSMRLVGRAFLMALCSSPCRAWPLEKAGGFSKQRVEEYHNAPWET